MPVRTSVQVSTRSPLTAVIRSPGLRPASFAGATGMSAVHSSLVCWPEREMSTHSLTEETCVVVTAMPLSVKMPVKRTRAMTRFIIGPPIMMMTRFHTGSW